MQDFRQLKVWHRAHGLALAVHRETVGFPQEERYGLRAQMRRAAVSVPANVAEGCGRGSDADFARFLGYATGSAGELEYYLLLARDLGYVDEPTSDVLRGKLAEVRKMLHGLRPSLTAPHPAADSC
ncbi:MAG: four helix bundle protein [Planctomycetota bacterium]|jgi:four helix bundle protein